MTNKPFWEETYENPEISTFGTEPNQTIVDFLDQFNQEGNVLEAGCGEGQNAIYLARQGFTHVEAFDLSENAIHKLKRIAKEDGVKLKAWEEDLCKFRFVKQYDLVLTFGTLHFIPKEDWRRFLLDAKENTKIGGYHVIQLFTDAVPASIDIAPYAVGLATEGELKELYQDWSILRFESYVFEDEHPNVPKHLHASNKIVAQRMK